MVYTQALVFGSGMTGKNERDNTMKGSSFPQAFKSDEEKTSKCGNLKKTQSSSSLGSECSLDEEGEDTCFLLDLSKRIEKCLCDAKGASLRCQELRLPLRMTLRLAEDIMRSSTDEPCGMRGALIHMYMENKGVFLKLGSVTLDQSLTPTFEISVVLRPDPGGWPPFNILFGGGKVLSLKREYKLIKQKLYSSALPTVLQFY